MQHTESFDYLISFNCHPPLYSMFHAQSYCSKQKTVIPGNVLDGDGANAIVLHVDVRCR